MVSTTHDPHPVGDRFLLGRGRSLATPAKGEVSVEERTRLGSGSTALEELTGDLERPPAQKGRGQAQGHPCG